MSTEQTPPEQEEAVFLYTAEPQFQETIAKHHFTVAGLAFCEEHKVGVIVITTAEKGATLTMECALESLISLASNLDDSEQPSS